MLNDRDEARVNDLLDGLLDPTEARALRDRFADEPELDHAWREMRRLRHLLRQDDGLRAPPDFRQQVRARIRATGTRPRSTPRTRRAWPWLVPAAAVILLGLALGRRESAETDLGLEAEGSVLPSSAPSLALLADSLDEGRARLDAILEGPGGEGGGRPAGLLLRTPPKCVILGSSIRRVTPEQFLRLQALARGGKRGEGASEAKSVVDANEGPPTLDVRVIIVAKEGGGQEAR